MAFTPFVETDQPTMAEFNEKFQECIQSALDAGVQIETGSYVGTGTYGASNPNTLTFEFSPKFIVIQPKDDTYADGSFYLFFSRGVLYTGMNGHTTVSWSSNSVSWYDSQNFHYQLNRANQTYIFTAIGKGASA